MQIIGLGNFTHPGTRHNAGMMLLDFLAQQWGATWSNNRQIPGLVAEKTLMLDNKGIEINCQVIMVLPKLFMNENGKAVHSASNFS